MIYLNRLGDGIRETVDQFENHERRVAWQELREHQVADKAAEKFWLSSRSCGDWKSK